MSRGDGIARRGILPPWRSATSLVATGLLVTATVWTPSLFMPAAAAVTGVSSLTHPVAADPAATIAPATQTMSGTIGTAVTNSTAFTPSGFTGEVTYSVAPALPDGLGININTGVVAGTPTTAQASADYVVTGTDGTSSASATITISVGNAAKPAKITPSRQTITGTAGEPITSTDAMNANGFAGSVTYSISPALPGRLKLDTNSGVISGTPTTVQADRDYTITGTDGTASDSATITIGVARSVAPPAILPATQAVVGIADTPLVDTDPLASTGFADVVVYTVLPALPEGLTLDKDTGVVSGTPTTAQAITDYVITGSDGTDTVTTAMTIKISPDVAPQLINLSTTAGMKITPVTLVPHGFPDPVTFALAKKSDPLPDGLILEPRTGVLRGYTLAPQLEATYDIVASDGTFDVTVPLTVAVACEEAGTEPPTCASGAAPALPEPDPGMMMAMAFYATPHVPTGTVATDTCALCHRTHSAKGSNYDGTQSLTTTGLCLSCHDGLGAESNVKLQYDSAVAAGKVNVAATRSYFMHDPAASDVHLPFYSDSEGDTVASTDFASPSTLRQSACVDCHNPHNATAVSPSASGLRGAWTASGALAGASGVSVVNGAAGTAPTYTLLGGTGSSITMEYQLCFKCHSSYTKLVNTGFTAQPSKEWLDKGLELNYNNPSFHPIEDAGTNRTLQMNASLSTANVANAGGTAPVKYFTGLTGTSTIRCANCHATDTVSPSGGLSQDLNAHTSPNRGILLANYRDRELSSITPGGITTPYSDGDFALCYTCHTNSPFGTSGVATGRTRFTRHRMHVSGIPDVGPVGASTDIDTPDAGAGNAICAECHFRLHSPVTEMTTYGGTQSLNGDRLVSFSPNIEPASNGRLAYVKNLNGSYSCYLTCHGMNHSPETYTPPAG